MRLDQGETVLKQPHPTNVDSIRVRAPAQTMPAGRVSRWIAYGYLVSVPFEIDLLVAGRSLSFWLALALIGVVIVELLAGSSTRYSYSLNSRMLLSVLALLFYTCASYLWSVDQTATFISAMVFSLTVATWAAVAVSVSGRVLEAFQALLVGTSVMSVMAINAEVNIDGRAELTANVNDVAALIAIVSAYLLSEILGRKKSLLRRLVFLGLLVLHLMAMLATGSRTGILAVAASAVVLLILHLMRARFAALATVLLLGVVLVNIAPALGVAIPERVAAIPAALDSGELSNREFYWQLAADEIPSVSGIGFGATPSWMGVQSATSGVIHSVYLGIALELGVIGVLLWIRFVWLVFQSARMSPQALALIPAAAAIAVMASTLTLEARRPLWVLLALMASHGILKRKVCEIQ